MRTENEKICTWCENRMKCNRYMTWLKDPNDLWVPKVDGCEKYEEREEQ